MTGQIAYSGGPLQKQSLRTADPYAIKRIFNIHITDKSKDILQSLEKPNKRLIVQKYQSHRIPQRRRSIAASWARMVSRGRSKRYLVGLARSGSARDC